MAGYTFQKTDASQLSASRNNFLSNDKHQQVLNAGSDNINNNGNKSEWAILSYLGRINYDYQKNIY